MDFQDKLTRLRERIEGNLPPASVKVMHQATQALKRSGIEAQVLGIGKTAPAFFLPNQHGDPRSLYDLLRQGPVVLTFYRGVWCPYCNADLQNLQRYAGSLEAAGATLLAISPEKPEYSAKMIRTRRLSFDILHDQRNEVAASYGLRWQVVDPLKSLYRDDLNINLARYHGDDDWTLPMPARFVIRSDGTVIYAESDADYTRRPDPEPLLEVLRTSR